jgi:hypothetical protein
VVECLVTQQGPVQFSLVTEYTPHVTLSLHLLQREGGRGRERGRGRWERERERENKRERKKKEGRKTKVQGDKKR